MMNESCPQHLSWSPYSLTIPPESPTAGAAHPRGRYQAPAGVGQVLCPFYFASFICERRSWKKGFVRTSVVPFLRFLFRGWSLPYSSPKKLPVGASFWDRKAHLVARLRTAPGTMEMLLLLLLLPLLWAGERAEGRGGGGAGPDAAAEPPCPRRVPAGGSRVRAPSAGLGDGAGGSVRSRALLLLLPPGWREQLYTHLWLLVPDKG